MVLNPYISSTNYDEPLMPLVKEELEEMGLP
jgi:hypothetical protein